MVGTGSIPNAAHFLPMSGCFKRPPIAPLSLATIAAGVLAGSGVRALAEQAGGRPTQGVGN